MRASSVEYHAPARFDELIEAFVRISRIGRTSVTYECAATREPDGALLATATQTIVLIDPIARRPVPVPEAFRACGRGLSVRRPLPTRKLATVPPAALP